MRTQLKTTVFAATLSVASSIAINSAHAQQHYPIGAEGIKAATLPPPGLYLRDYNLIYFADQINDPNGHAMPMKFDLTAYANSIRPIYITDFKVLGANYGMDLLVPLVYSSINVAGHHDDSFGLGDLFVEPVTLSWHWSHADLSVAYGFWAPTGDYDPARLSTPGSGFWSHMFTLGGTYHTAGTNAWSASVLTRYEIATEQSDTGITPGDTFSLEWGLSKAFRPEIEAGLIGYYQQQVDDASGPGIAGGSQPSRRVFGVGPELSLFCPKLGFFVSARYAREFGAEARPDGNTITVTLTKRF